SNIFNVLFILGASAVIAPLIVAQQLVRFDVPLMIGLSAIVLLLGLDGAVGRLDGLLLFAALIAYTAWGILQSRREQPEIQREYEQEFGGAAKPATAAAIALDVVFVVAGLGLLVLGSRWFADAAVSIARDLGLSELVIGLTIVAAGTSLPEVATSLLAAWKGERDIAVGNVVGSNLFNLMGVLGLSAAVAPDGVAVSADALRFDLPVMIAVAVACLPVFFTGHVIARWEGGLFLAYYAAYTAYLILDATAAPVQRTFATIMLGFVLPLTVVTLAVGAFRAVRQPRGRPGA
ncbi:MAG TPA: calcium/sodium antiporter, partial [Planctomycetaceae bacterium]|nr:calcium/sodium antiporter [Planctomycetaceae bacterium]